MRFKSYEEVREYIESVEWPIDDYMGRFAVYIAREKEPKSKIIKSLETELQKERESRFADVPREFLLRYFKDRLSAIEKEGVEAFRNRRDYLDRKERFDNVKKEVLSLF
jgi:hypothetical protein